MECQDSIAPLEPRAPKVSQVGKLKDHRGHSQTRVIGPASEKFCYLRPEQLCGEVPLETSPNNLFTGTNVDVLDATVTQRYETNDPCTHCAAQGLDINARDARTNADVSGQGEGVHSNFHSNLRAACEFPYSLKCLLAESIAWTNKSSPLLPLKLAELCSIKIPGARVVLRLNDHLIEQEDKRSWVLLIEGQTLETVASLLRQIEGHFANSTDVIVQTVEEN
ncbi:unnamed protein product [Dibothriocephalus latus]|uniref:Uncharacterized protein n=1 Tax=Dibothriocephalus latus TaxID=60516 RepID=A0A3P7LA09_DIBLA|nr:unnamed protein product [Dibothriocephalus latus]